MPLNQLLTSIHFPASNILSHLPHLPDLLSSIGESHSHSHSVATVVTESPDDGSTTAVLDPNAAWTALLSVVVKEWLYRVTKKVGEEEGSSVLAANVRLIDFVVISYQVGISPSDLLSVPSPHVQALHHRSDAFTSFVALVSILGSHAGLPILDPLGGIFVSTILLSQSSILSYRSALTLLDSSCPESTLSDAQSIAEELREDDGVRGQGWAVGSVKGVGGGGGAQMEVEVMFLRDKEWKLKDAEEVGNMLKARLEEEISIGEVSHVLCLEGSMP